MLPMVVQEISLPEVEPVFADAPKAAVTGTYVTYVVT